jgi:hypothetical protein
MHSKPKSNDPESAASSPWLTPDLALEGGPRDDRRDRLRYVLGHPMHWVGLGVLLLMSVFSGSLAMLSVAMLYEVLAVALVPRLKPVRVRADRRSRERRRQTAARARSNLVAHMEALHGRELTELERRAAIARSHASTAGDAMEAMVDDWYGVDRLLGTYVKLSIAHRMVRESGALTDRERLWTEIRILEHERERARSPRLRRLVEKQLGLLRTRATCLERNEEEREAIALELGSVASLCRLVHERSMALVGTSELHGDVERLVGEMQLQDQAIAELTGAAAHESAASQGSPELGEDLASPEGAAVRPPDGVPNRGQAHRPHEVISRAVTAPDAGELAPRASVVNRAEGAALRGAEPWTDRSPREIASGLAGTGVRVAVPAAAVVVPVAGPDPRDEVEELEPHSFGGLLRAAALR